MARQDSSRKKGFFSNILLGVSRKYIMPRSRGGMIRFGLIVVAVVLLYTAVDTILLGSNVLSSGELSSRHAMIGSDCSRCHVSAGDVTNSKCGSCHEKSGDELGVYSFDAHYFYRSENFARINTSRKEHGGDEQGCYSCHPEHNGRMEPLTVAPDSKCVSCNPYGSFNSDHPEFEFATKKIPDDSTLLFTHVRHTDFVIKKLNKERGTNYIEESCLYCHTPRTDGKTFQPLDFDKHCVECHLTTEKKTKPVPIAVPGIAGLETVEMIRARGGPGTRWAFYSNPNEYSYRGDRIVKSPVYHKDPWVMENLKQLRAKLYVDDGLADIMQAFGKTNIPQTRKRYLEAIATLEKNALELRSRSEPEVQSEVAMINNYLRILRSKVERGQGMLNDSALDLSSLMPNPDITPAQRQMVEALAKDLTSVCQECHVVSEASIQRVAADQRIFRRAEFNHAAHILDRQCLECHTDIPVTKKMAGGKKVTMMMDRALIQNIPRKDNCLECHSASKASNTCVSCHQFHPNKNNRSNLKLFVDR